MTNGEFLLDLAERRESEACDAYSDGREKASQQMLVDAERLREIGEQMVKDEKYPAVRP